MNFEIIPINEQAGVRTVNARELHEFLCVGKMFAHWIKDRIEQYGFEEGKDFTIDLPFSANQKTGRGGDRRSKEYHLSMDMAKELSMVERTHHGKLARQYFIACEKQLLEQQLQKLQAAQPSFDPALVAELTHSRLYARAENPMERATFLEELRQGRSVNELVEQLGGGRAQTYRLISLLKLPEAVQQAVRARKLSVTAATRLGKLPAQKQATVLRTICTKNLSERESFALIRGSFPKRKK